ncbi:dicarboxylate/amino acid:cation symporter [Rickettsia endosymbiont of Cardiosporidium cionae]|uniref:dicarboxylate/amino acid:cation symporter n=1 Tax=Rickettsia endosymbiont of Cardiosporidium cionae TaxID=2777155 RepID=UPI001892F772|nr:dicarboxylate/amino acid:cation symporter [Rickettsia endosymbiont of Cardiosporidium cionae]KAF8818963.1 dicarboxylate/amino acid:cation symporter [Rickettsia endosymbiont of Cardiosporidium cionae]
MRLWQKVIIGLVLGILSGIYYPQYSKLLEPLGVMFLNLIKMTILPLIFFTIISGITSVSDPRSLGRVGAKSIFAYFSTTFFAVIFGLCVAIILKPGKGLDLGIEFLNYTPNMTSHFDLVYFIVNIIPNNIVNSFTNNNILQVVFFAIFTGITINKMQSKNAAIKNSVAVLSKLFIKMISQIILLSPYGSFVLTACVIANQGTSIIFCLSKLIIAIVIAMILQYIIFGILIVLFARISPIPFYKKSIDYQLIAFSTGSSKASLATTMDVCINKLGISNSSTSFILPLGASMNMDGMAINLGLTTIFFAQTLGITLSYNDYIIIIMMATLGSIGGAGIPGASLIMLPMVLSSVNINIDSIALIAGIDRILDLLRTVINITGDATITLIIDKTEGTLDEKTYYNNL